MPTYDYRCTACKHAFERFQSMKDAPLRKCPECGKNALERLIGTGAAVLFKGSGFYQTDYRSESYRKSAEADKPAASGANTVTADTATGSAPGADGKTAAKSSGTDPKPSEAKVETSPVTKPRDGKERAASKGRRKGA